MKTKQISNYKDVYNYEKKHPNEWRRVLHDIYKENWVIYGTRDINKEHPLIKKLKISVRSLQKSISFLRENDLIKIVGKDSHLYLNPKGFDVAREEQNRKLNAILQTVIIYFTTIIAITAMFNLFNNLNLMSNWNLFSSYILTVGIFAVYVYHKIFKRLIF